MTAIEMRQKRAAIWSEAQAFNDSVAAENRDMSAEENTKYNNMIKEIDELRVKIDREEKRDQLNAEMRGSTGGAVPPAAGEGEKTTEEMRKVAFRAWLVGGEQNLNTEQRDIMKEFRAQSVGTTTAGGFTVPQGFYSQINDALKFFGGIRQSNATILRTNSGNPLPMPTGNDTSVIGELVTENTAGSGTADLVFGSVTLGAYMFSSKTVLVSYELLQDSGIDIEAYISLKLGQRIGRAQNAYFTTGTGTSQPQGVVTGATLGKTGLAGQTTSVIYDDLVDLVHAVDPAYRVNKSHWMMADSSLKVIRKLKDSTGRPLWQPGVASGMPDTIFEYPYVINQDMAVMAASAKSIAFGDFSNFYVRDVKDVQLYRIVDKYIETRQVGFIAYARADSKMVDAGMHPVAYYANSAS